MKRKQRGECSNPNARIEDVPVIISKISSSFSVHFFICFIMNFVILKGKKENRILIITSYLQHLGDSHKGHSMSNQQEL